MKSIGNQFYSCWIDIGTIPPRHAVIYVDKTFCLSQGGSVSWKLWNVTYSINISAFVTPCFRPACFRPWRVCKPCVVECVRYLWIDLVKWPCATRCSEVRGSNPFGPLNSDTSAQCVVMTVIFGLHLVKESRRSAQELDSDLWLASDHGGLYL